MPRQEHSFTIRVQAGPHDRLYVPLCVKVPEALADAAQGATVAMRPAGSGRSLPAQIEECCAGPCVRFVLDKLRRGEVRDYVVSLAPGKPKTTAVAFRKLKDKMRVTINGELLTEYVFAGERLARPYLYPVIGPGGVKVTRPIGWESKPGFDHPHHKSVWVAHGLVNGTDNWSEGPRHGYTKHVEFTCIEQGPATGCLCSSNIWTTRDGLEILKEERVLRFYNQPAAARCFDVTLTFQAGEDAVLFGDTKEGGLLSVRVQPTMNASAEGTIENSYGAINEAETWGKRAMWCDYSGPAEGRHVGIAVFDHPDNYGYPTHWHVRNYGLMTANPFGLSHYTRGEKRGDWVLGAHREAIFRYRLYLHEGNAAQGKVAERFHDWVNPPKVEVI